MTAIARATAPLALTLQLFTACNEPLTAKNFNNPDIERIFSEPPVIEQAIASGFQQCHNSTISMLANGSGGVHPQLLVLAFENAVAGGDNFAGMGTRQAIPRVPVQNAGTDIIANGNNFVDFGGLSRLSRFTSWALAALDRLQLGGRSLGTPAQDARARAFGLFVMGCALGNLALVYDSAAIVSSQLPNDSIPPLSGATDVMTTALVMMDSAIVIARSAEVDGSGGFPLPASWTGGTAGMSRDDFIRFVRTWKARFRAGVARTPAERAAVDWTKVIADADAGISRDLTIRVGGTTGWRAGYLATLNGDSPANQMAPFYVGMADVSGAYDTWLATPLEERRPILIVTPDRRFPQGLTHTEQQANSVVATDYLSLPLLFHRTDNRPLNDPWSSFYSLTRYAYLAPAGGGGELPIMLRAEMDLLMAEGYIRLNQLAEAAAKIDITRVGRGQLPPISGTMNSLTDPVPGGANCVPRVPAPPDFSSTRCGNILEAMKWEKRLETAFVGYGAWFMDARGWGDLIEGSPLEWPVPFQELQVRKKPFYSLGGGGPSSARRGTYGF